MGVSESIFESVPVWTDRSQNRSEYKIIDGSRMFESYFKNVKKINAIVRAELLYYQIF